MRLEKPHGEGYSVLATAYSGKLFLPIDETFYVTLINWKIFLPNYAIFHAIANKYLVLVSQ